MSAASANTWRAAFLLCVVLVSFEARAQSNRFSFAEVVSSTDSARRFGAPAVNNAGTVVYPTGLNTFSGLAVGPSMEAVTGFDARWLAGRAINDSGTVAWYGTTPTGQPGVFSRTGTASVTNPVQVIATDPPYQITNLGPFNPTVISNNNSGTVAFYARRRNPAAAGIFVGPNPDRDVVVTDATGALSHEVLSLNNNGGVAYMVGYQQPGSGVFSIEPGSRPVAVATNAGPFEFFGSAAMNDSGRVAFAARLDNRIEGVFTGPDPVRDAVATTAGPFSHFGLLPGYVDMNNNGIVVFLAGLDSSGSGVFAGPDAVNDRIIALGDVLFGSTVRDFRWAPGGLNDRGDVAFAYDLNDGRHGIAVARLVPEPAGALLATGTAAAGILRRTRRRRVKPK